MKRNLLLVISLTLAIGACSTASLHVPTKQAITEERVDKIVVGKTTKEELVKMFGKPETRIASEDGLVYFFKDDSLASLWVVFDEDWLVKEIEVSD
jgi:hypothetical protein